jgi:hypothetical protein
MQMKREKEFISRTRPVCNSNESIISPSSSSDDVMDDPSSEDSASNCASACTTPIPSHKRRRLEKCMDIRDDQESSKKQMRTTDSREGDEKDVRADCQALLQLQDSCLLSSSSSVMMEQ